jgi:hypothetical protein
LVELILGVRVIVLVGICHIRCSKENAIQEVRKLGKKRKISSCDLVILEQLRYLTILMFVMRLPVRLPGEVEINAYERAPKEGGAPG